MLQNGTQFFRFGKHCDEPFVSINGGEYLPTEHQLA
jgi:hypothetical protein